MTSHCMICHHVAVQRLGSDAVASALGLQRQILCEVKERLDLAVTRHSWRVQSSLLLVFGSTKFAVSFVLQISGPRAV